MFTAFVVLEAVYFRIAQRFFLDFSKISTALYLWRSRGIEASLGGYVFRKTRKTTNGFR